MKKPKAESASRVARESIATAIKRAAQAEASGKDLRPLSYEKIDRGSFWGKSIYATSAKLIREHHQHLDERRIVFAWHYGWSPDVDGRLVLGKCKKATDLDKELHDFDFVIILNHEFFVDDGVEDKQRSALIFHELCHTAEKLDRDGEPVLDGHGRRVYRTRKHDIEEFEAVVANFGIYTHQLERFAKVLHAKRAAPLFADDVPLSVGEEAVIS